MKYIKMKKEDKYLSLIVRSLTDGLTDEEQKDLEAWISADEAHRKYYDETLYAWQAADIYKKVTDQERQEDLQALRKKISPATFENNPAAGRKNRFTVILKYTAVFIIAFSLGTLFYYLYPNHRKTKKVTYNEIITQKGQKAKVLLSDGSIVWLNAESRLKYPTSFSDKERKVILTGEAFFKVMKTSEHNPFLVKAGNIRIRVTGTKFNVKAYPEEDVIETTLVEGSITLLRKIGDEYQMIRLKPDQKATLVRKGSKISINDIRPDKPTIAFVEKMPRQKANGKEKIIISPNVDIEAHTAWKENYLVFEKESFEDIAYEMERWFNVRITFLDNSLKRYCYTGKFVHNESLEQILNVIQLTTPFKYKIEKNNVIIYK
jgi:ferric-dicitrate binding protein FerR (iron transport regulator)